LAQEAGVRLCLENHTEAFADEVVWAINRVNHPFVGGCVDTNNSLMVGENPLEAVQKAGAFGLYQSFFRPPHRVRALWLPHHRGGLRHRGCAHAEQLTA
jgi:hypothetical protein